MIKPVKLLFITAVISLAAFHISFGASHMNNATQEYIGKTTQKISITFHSEIAAKNAKVQLIPLYHGYDAAFSTRWDDNNTDNLSAHKVMVQYGQKGTFYLNDPQIYYGTFKVNDPVDTITKTLVTGGNAVGVHTLTHEFLPYLSKNRQFREILEDRIDIEVSSQSPVTSFTYPFIAKQLELDTTTSYDDIEEMLLRSGIYSAAEEKGSNRLITTTPVFIDGKPFWNNMSIEKAKSAVLEGTERTLYLNTMHAWPHSWGGSDFPVLADVFKLWGGNPRWWYCNTNEYAAYRYQFLHTTIETSLDKKTLMITLSRPNLYGLNNDIPLTLSLEGIGKNDIASVSPTVRLTGDASPEVMLDCYYDTPMTLPAAYGKIANPENGDRLLSTSTIGNIEAVLHKSKNNLALRIKNNGTQAFTNVHITFRLPLQYSQGVIEKNIGNIAAGEETTLTISPKVQTHDFLYTCDPQFYAAQIDYHAGKQTRIYATCIAEGVDTDHSYSRDGFLVLGPIPSDRSGFDYNTFIDKLFTSPTMKKTYRLFDNVDVTWTAFKAGKLVQLDPNIIYTTGKPRSLNIYSNEPAIYYPYGVKLNYVLWGTIVSPKEMTATQVFQHDHLKRLMVNGEEIKGDTLFLKKGRNDIKILYSPIFDYGDAYSPHFYGAYFRLTDRNGERIRDIEFLRPEL